MWHSGLNMAADSPDEQLNDRARYLLTVLVESYIREGQPVGSRTLTRDSGLSLSSATVRNVMADLEEYGFVTSPHTSAGRVPTDKGYRFFVDTLLRRGNVDAADDAVDELRRRLDDEHPQDARAVVAVASQVLSSITHLAGVVTMPRQAQQSLSQIEFLPLSDNRVLAVMVVNGRDVQNRIVQLDRYYSAEELRRAANFLNQQFSGRPLSQVREDIVEELKQTGERLNQLMLDAIRVAQQMVSEGAQAGPEYVIAGETNLMEFAELGNVDKLRRLVRRVYRQAGHPAPARPEPEGRRGADIHRPRIRLPDPGRLQPGGGSLHDRPAHRRGARSHRTHAHGLRAGDPDRGCHGPDARVGLEFPPLAPITAPIEARPARPWADA